jgi:DNA-binding SARP family transcriptional activator
VVSVGTRELLADETFLDPGLHIGVLGQLVVVRHGREVSLRPGERTVLALLAMAVGRSVSQDAFAEVLWPGKRPASSASVLYTYISRLRSALGASPAYPVKDRIRKEVNGYALTVSPDELDVMAFRQLRDAARRTSDASKGFQLHSRALKLWRGQPLDGIDALSGYPSVAALAEERVSALLELADAASITGRHDGVLEMLREEAARQPLNEAVHARLIVALAALGRQSEALNHYEELRGHLDRELGVLPSALLREAHARVVRQEIVTGANETAWRPLFQLPAAPADFTGRTAEVAAIARAVSPLPGGSGVPVVVVCGAPGIGKTTLALHVAHGLRDRFPDGHLWVPLTGASPQPRDACDVLGDLLRALGIPNAAIPADRAGRASLYRSRLAGRKVLLIADDAGSTDNVAELIPGTPGAALLVTSRTCLVGLEGAALIPIEVMAECDATELLTKIIGESRAAAEPEALTALSRACGLLPLALRIVGARLAVLPLWSLSSMVRTLNGTGGRLAELEADGISVRASIATSYYALSDKSRLAFRRLALLGPADFGEWVIGVLVGESDVSAVTREIAERSLLTPLGVDGAGQPRYRLHDLLRDYAWERLNAEPDASRAAAVQRLLDAWLQLATLAGDALPAEPFFPRPGPAATSGPLPSALATRLAADPSAWFTSEYSNLITGVELAYRCGFTEIAFQLTCRMSPWIHLQDRCDDAEYLWNLALASTGDLDGGTDRLHAGLRVAASKIEQGHSGDALPLLNDCAAEAERNGRWEMLALIVYWRGCSYLDADRVDDARHEAQRGVELAIQVGSGLAEYLNLRILSAALGFRGESELAIPAAEAAVNVASRLGSPHKLAAMHNLAWALALAGRYDRAAQVSRERLALSRQLGDVRGEALSSAVLGQALHGLGDHDSAAQCLHFALSVFREHHARRHEAVCLQKLGSVYAAMACYPEAISYLDESLMAYQELRAHTKVSAVEKALDRYRVLASGTR